MKLPRLPEKWIRGSSAGEVITKSFTVLGFVFVLAVLLLVTDGPDRYCDCPDQQRPREQARGSVTEREAVELQAAIERREKEREAVVKAVRTPAAERVRQALKEWEREQAESEALVRAVLESKEVGDAAAEPAAEVAPR